MLIMGMSLPIIFINKLSLKRKEEKKNDNGDSQDKRRRKGTDSFKAQSQFTFSFLMSSPSRLTGGSIANNAIVWRIWLWTMSLMIP